MLIGIIFKWTGRLGIVIVVIGLLRWIMTLKSEPDDYNRVKCKMEFAAGIILSFISFYVRKHM